MSDCYAGVEAMNRMTKERLAELEKFAERLPPTDQINSRLIEAINALKAERAKVAELSRGEPCAVCGGAPNPSGLRCICDDTGRLSVAEFNARSRLITAEAQLTRLREENRYLKEIYVDMGLHDSACRIDTDGECDCWHERFAAELQSLLDQTAKVEGK